MTKPLIEIPIDRVRSPARYIGNELNCCSKPRPAGGISFGLCVPQKYDIAMSNLGVRIIYALLNKRRDCLCERLFLPDMDMQEFLQERSLKLFSLETNRPIDEFDILGFSLQYELDFLSFARMLLFCGIPLFSNQRSSFKPLIIAGGCALSNPEPVADYFDAMVIGEAEEAIGQIIGVFKRSLKKKDKGLLLRDLSKIKGVYVPSLYHPQYAGTGRYESMVVEKGSPQTVTRCFIRCLDRSFYPQRWIVPYVPIIHDKVMIEVMRGCPHVCRFCQARSFYQPFRTRSYKKIVKLARGLIDSSGYEEVSLLGLSASDHPDFYRIADTLIKGFKSSCVNVSLGSLRPGKKLISALERIASVKKTGLTLAIEASSPALRKLIGKNVDVASIKELIICCQKLGYKRVKFYFMYGLPFETLDDLEGISLLLKELVSFKGSARLLFAVSVNPFVPKPHTVFQYYSMQSAESLLEKKEFIKKSIFSKFKNIKLDIRNPYESLVEAILSRADRRVSGAISDICRYEERDWHDYRLWEEKLKNRNIDISDYLEYSKDRKLAWSHILLGCNELELKSQYLETVELARSMNRPL